MRSARRYAALIFLTLCLLLSGCVKGDFHITVNKDGSGEVENKLAFNAQMLALMSMSNSNVNPLEEMKKSYESENYKVALFKDGDYQGITATKHVDDVSALQNLSGHAKGINPEMGALKIEKASGIFQNKYNVSAQLDMSDLKPDQEDTMGIQKMMLNQMDLKLTVTLPGEAANHNASRVLKDKHTYQWDIIAGQKNEIQLSYDAPNRIVITIGVVIVLLVLAGIVVGMLKRTRKLTATQEITLEE